MKYSKGLGQAISCLQENLHVWEGVRIVCMQHCRGGHVRGAVPVSSSILQVVVHSLFISLSLSFLLSLAHILQRSHVFQPPLLKNLYWAPSIFPAYFYAQKVFCILSKEIFLPLVIPILYSPLNSPRCPVMRISSSLDYRHMSLSDACFPHLVSWRRTGLPSCRAARAAPQVRGMNRHIFPPKEQPV